MIKSIFLLSFTVIFLSIHRLQAQFMLPPAEKPLHKREIGFTIGKLEDMFVAPNLTYKRRLGQSDRFLRLSGQLQGALQTTEAHGASGFFNSRVAGGIEWRRNTGKWATLYHGFELGTGAALYKISRNNFALAQKQFSAAYVLGAQFHLNSKWGLNVEFLPQLTYTRQSSNYFAVPPNSLQLNTPAKIGVFMKF